MNSHLKTMYVSLSKCCTKYVKSPIVYLHFEGGTGNIKFLSFMSFLESQISKHFMIQNFKFCFHLQLKRLRYNSKKRVPQIKAITTPLAFSFILMIKCVSGSKKLLTIFGGSESKQKQNSKLVGPHQSFILHLKSKNIHHGKCCYSFIRLKK